MPLFLFFFAPMKWISELRFQLKLVFDLIRNERLKTNILQALPFWVGSLATGLIAVGFTKLFSLAEAGMLAIFSLHHWYLFLLTPVCFVVAWWVVHRFAPNAKGSGIPQVMAAIDLANPKSNHKVNQLLSIRIIWVKIVSSLVMIFGGAAVGREGPTIQIAGSVFRKVNQLVPESWPKISKRNMIITGAAAGLAAAFNTPLGGIVFAVEELAKTHIRFFRLALFTAVIIAGLTAQGLLGPYLYLGYPDVSQLKASAFFGVIVTAIVAALCAGFMSKGILKLTRWKSKYKRPAQTLIILIISALIIASLAVWVSPKVLGSGKTLMNDVLFTSEKSEEWYVPLLRMVGIMLSFTSGAAGGVFAPSLGAGASIGAFLSNLFGVTDSNANILILSGMVGFLTGVTRTPFTSAILVLEMTDRHSVIFHLMIAGIIANIVAMAVDKHSLYEHLKLQYYHEALQQEETVGPEEKEAKG